MRWTCKRSAAHSRTSVTAGSSRRGSGLMCTLELCATQKEFGTSNARTSMHAPTATNTTGPIPNGPVFLCREAYRKGRRQTHRTASSVIVTNMSMTRTATVTSSMRSGTRANVVGGRVRGKAACETRKEERV